VIVLCWSMYL